MTIRLVVIDDHPMVCVGVCSELEHSGVDLVIVGEAADVEGTVTACHEFEPDAVLLDVHLPGGQGGGGAEMSAHYQDIEGLCFLALSVSDSPEDVIQAIRSGARGYMTESIPIPELVEATQRVVPGDAAFSPRSVGFVLDAFGTGQVAIGDNELDPLSVCEQEVIRLIIRGYTYKEVGNGLFTSAKTMETHVPAVLRRPQLFNRNELTCRAMQRHIV